MFHIVIITGRYYPYFSACGNCINNIAQELKKENEITVIASKNDFRQKKYDEYEGIPIVRIRENFDCFHTFCVNGIRKSKGAFKLFFYLLLQAKRVVFTVKNLFRLQSVNPLQVRHIVQELRRIEKKHPVDFIVPASAPHEAVFAAIRYQRENRNVKVLPFQMDHFSDTDGIYKFRFVRFFRYHRHIELEKQALRECRHLFILPHLQEHYQSEEFREYAQKITVLEHPLFRKRETGGGGIKNGAINLVYLGSLDVRLRNPEYLLRMLKFVPGSRIYLHIYPLGNCGRILEKYKKILGNKLQIQASVPLETAFRIMEKSDILLNIGNNAPNEIPSKLFDYLSFGKPVIHLYYLEEDSCLKYLKPYSFSLCLKMDENRMEQNARLFSEFCSKNAGQTMPYDKLYRIYYPASPEYAASQISRYLKKET